MLEVGARLAVHHGCRALAFPDFREATLIRDACESFRLNLLQDGARGSCMGPLEMLVRVSA